MKGSRPLANSEILLVAKQFYGVFAIRNRSLFMLGVSYQKMQQAVEEIAIDEYNTLALLLRSAKM